MSTVTVQSSDLLKALDLVSDTVGKNTKSIELHKCFYFGNGKVESFNGEMGSSANISLGDTSFCIGADKFHDLIKELKGAIEFTLTDGLLNIKCEKFKTAIPTVDSRAWTTMVHKDLEDYYDMNDLPTILSRVSFAAGRNLQQPNWLGVTLSGQYAYAGDGVTLARTKLGKEVGRRRTLPTDMCQLIEKHSAFEKLCVAKGSSVVVALFNKEENKTVSSTLEDKFPTSGVDKLVSVTSESYVELPPTLSSAISRVILAGEDKDVVIKNVPGTGLIVSTKTAKGRATEGIDWEYATEFKFKVSSTLFLRLLSKIKKIDLAAVISGVRDKVRFLSPDGDTMYLLGLVNMTEEEKTL